MPNSINLKKLERELDLKLKKQAREGLSTIYKEVSCSGVAKEIKAGRNVVGNAEYGIRTCVHSKVAPRVNPKTLKFYPQTQKQKDLEERFIKTVNKLLESGGFKKMSSSLLTNIRKKDKKFEQDIKKRRKGR